MCWTLGGALVDTVDTVPISVWNKRNVKDPRNFLKGTLVHCLEAICYNIKGWHRRSFRCVWISVRWEFFWSDICFRLLPFVVSRLSCSFLCRVLEITRQFFKYALAEIVFGTGNWRLLFRRAVGMRAASLPKQKTLICERAAVKVKELRQGDQTIFWGNGFLPPEGAVVPAMVGFLLVLLPAERTGSCGETRPHAKWHFAIFAANYPRWVAGIITRVIVPASNQRLHSSDQPDCSLRKEQEKEIDSQRLQLALVILTRTRDITTLSASKIEQGNNTVWEMSHLALEHIKWWAFRSSMVAKLHSSHSKLRGTWNFFGATSFLLRDEMGSEFRDGKFDESTRPMWGWNCP